MPSISETIARLQRFNGGFALAGAAPNSHELVPFETSGRNPGALRAFLHVPADLPAGAPLVVVMHGCTQSAEAYHRGSGWSALADRFGFAVLYPEQQRTNNPNLCFNWFAPADTRRGSGEAESIREMVVAAVERHGLDPARVFVTGLSAGGAMTSVMLATYPEVFAAGAIIAGLPYGTANTIPEALERMRGHGHDRTALSQRVRSASAHRGRWPVVSVWHGTADMTVDVTNAAMIVEQWKGIHGVSSPPIETSVDGQAYRAWHDATGRLVIEDYMVAGLGHGTPIATQGDEACGVPGPHMLDAAISSTYRIAASWHIVPAIAPERQDPATDTPAASASGPARPAAHPFDPGQAIGAALRAAGLMSR